LYCDARATGATEYVPISPLHAACGPEIDPGLTGAATAATTVTLDAVALKHPLLLFGVTEIVAFKPTCTTASTNFTWIDEPVALPTIVTPVPTDQVYDVAPATGAIEYVYKLDPGLQYDVVPVIAPGAAGTGTNVNVIELVAAVHDPVASVVNVNDTVPAAISSADGTYVAFNTFADGLNVPVPLVDHVPFDALPPIDPLKLAELPSHTF
jgi:hypothetical protein